MVADGFWRRAQLALDTTVSPLRRDGTTRPRSANFDGAALKLLDEERKLLTLNCPVKVGTRLVVLAAEVGGRWSAETAQFLTALAKARAQEVPPLVLQGRAETAWVRRWSVMLACSVLFALSLLDRRPVSGSDAVVPSVSEVMRESRFC